MILTYSNLMKKSILNRDLGDQYLQMEIFLHYDENWNIIPKHGVIYHISNMMM
jgi:hypothetical protein